MPRMEKSHDSTSSLIAEQRMRWKVLEGEIEERLALEQSIPPKPARLHPFVTISRQTGTGASQIARRVGQRLGWNVVDREVLSHLLKEDPHSVGMFDQLDEQSSNWVVEVFGKWLDDHLMTQMEFVAKMEKILTMAARLGSAVFVGRGAQFVLPIEFGMAVRIVAPMDQRVDWAMRTHHLTSAEARRWVERQDQGRKDFIRSYFHHDEEQAQLYDLVINLAHMDENEAAEIIVTHCQHRFSRPVELNAV